jgi:hypothetical protein
MANRQVTIAWCRCRSHERGIAIAARSLIGCSVYSAKTGTFVGYGPDLLPLAVNTTSPRATLLRP